MSEISFIYTSMLLRILLVLFVALTRHTVTVHSLKIIIVTYITWYLKEKSGDFCNLKITQVYKMLMCKLSVIR